MTITAVSRAHRSGKVVELQQVWDSMLESLVAQANDIGCGILVEHFDGSKTISVSEDVRPMHVKEYWR